MNTSNPYQAPASENFQGHVNSPEGLQEIELLIRQRKAVRCVGIMTALFAIGCALSCFFGILYYFSYARDKAAIIGSIGELIKAAAFAYVTFLVWHCNVAISQVIEIQESRLKKLFATQRSCWYGIAALAALYLVMPLITAGIVNLVR